MSDTQTCSTAKGSTSYDGLHINHEELIADMQLFNAELQQSPDKSREFLRLIGVLRENGDIRHLMQTR